MTDKLPLDGVRVVEFSHMVMGPTCGLALADLGADVIKVEPVGRRQHASTARRGRRFLHHLQPQQAQPGARSENREGPGLSPSA